MHGHRVRRGGRGPLLPRSRTRGRETEPRGSSRLAEARPSRSNCPSCSRGGRSSRQGTGRICDVRGDPPPSHRGPPLRCCRPRTPRSRSPPLPRRSRSRRGRGRRRDEDETAEAVDERAAKEHPGRTRQRAEVGLDDQRRPATRERPSPPWTSSTTATVGRSGAGSGRPDVTQSRERDALGTASSETLVHRRSRQRRRRRSCLPAR